MFEEKICINCGYIGWPKNKVKGSFGVELILWLLLIVPGLIYSVWRLASRYKACPECGAPNMISLDSPRGKQLAEQYKITISKSRYPTLNKD